MWALQSGNLVVMFVLERKWIALKQSWW